MKRGRVGDQESLAMIGGDEDHQGHKLKTIEGKALSLIQVCGRFGDGGGGGVFD